MGSNARNTEESMWPSIPTCLLWMIKDKLDIFDDTRLSLVCRDWKLASVSYPREESLAKGVPFLMRTSEEEATGSTRDFICVATKNKYTLQLPEFQTSYILYSKHGWFLMKQKQEYSNSSGDLDVFLLNPIERTKITLPSIKASRVKGIGSFSIHEGYPHCVVLHLVGYDHHITFKTAYMGDKMWTDHTYNRGSNLRGLQFCQLVIIREHVYGYDCFGNMLVCNMDTKVWKEVPTIPDDYSENKYFTEYEDHVICIHQAKKSSDLSFFKCNDTKTAWEKLNYDDLKDTSWFLRDGFHCNVAKGKGLKVYDVGPKSFDGIISFLAEQSTIPWYPIVTCEGSIVCYNLMDGSEESVSFPYNVSRGAKWAHI